MLKILLALFNLVNEEKDDFSEILQSKKIYKTLSHIVSIICATPATSVQAKGFYPTLDTKCGHDEIGCKQIV